MNEGNITGKLQINWNDSSERAGFVFTNKMIGWMLLQDKLSQKQFLGGLAIYQNAFKSSIYKTA